MHIAKRDGPRRLGCLRPLAERAGIATVLLCAACFSAEAGRIDGAQLGSAAPVPTLSCPPKIVPKCKPGEKPYCAELSGPCCRVVSCRAAIK